MGRIGTVAYSTNGTTGAVTSKLPLRRGLARVIRQRRPRREECKEEEEEADEVVAVVVPPAEREGAGEEGGDVVAVASTMPPNNARCFLLDCDEALPGIVAHLDGKGLAALGSTCKHLRELVNGHDGKRWWKRLCRTLLVGEEDVYFFVPSPCCRF